MYRTLSAYYQVVVIQRSNGCFNFLSTSRAVHQAVWSHATRTTYMYVSIVHATFNSLYIYTHLPRGATRSEYAGPHGVYVVSLSRQEAKRAPSSWMDAGLAEASTVSCDVTSTRTGGYGLFRLPRRRDLREPYSYINHAYLWLYVALRSPI